jgi:hypothetical protein
VEVSEGIEMKRIGNIEEFRETWFLLVIVAQKADSDQCYTTGYGIGIAHADKLLETDTVRISNESEEDQLLLTLGEELNNRRYQNMTITTSTKQPLRFLRSRFLETDCISDPTFRGYHHLVMNDIVDEYIDREAASSSLSIILDRSPFNSDRQTQKLETAVEQLWQLRVTLGPLVPAEALQGHPL